MAISLWASNNNLIFHFDFKDAAGKKQYTDQTGKFTAVVKDGKFAVQNGALRTSIGSQISIKDTRKKAPVKELTVMSWILKKSTPDHTPILSKGEHPRNLQFTFSIGWRYPGFFYKKVVNKLNGIYYIGTFGSGTHYPDNKWIKPKAKLIEISGRWHHLAAVFNQGEVKIYIDGKLSVERFDEKGNFLPANDRPFYIAAQRVAGENANMETADMLLNDLRLYNKALLEEDIKKIIANETQKYPKGNLIPKGKTHLEALDDCWSYLPDEYDVEMAKVLPVTQKFEASKKEVQNFSKGIIAKRKMVNNLPALSINGEVQTLVQGVPNLKHYKTHRYLYHKHNMGLRNFAAAGINLVSVSASPAMFWKGEKKYDWKELDDVCMRTIKANPNCKIMVYATPVPPAWFVKKYPNELEQSYFGQNLRLQISAGPLGSDIWMEIQKQMVFDLVSHLEKSPAGKHIYAYLIGGGQSAEWYWPASVYGAYPGFSEGTRKSFRNYLKDKYKTNAALQKAWQDAKVTFKTADVPSVQERKNATFGVFQNPLKSAKVIDFRRYQTYQTLRQIASSTQAVKDASKNKKLTVIYSGYDLPITALKLFNSGLCGSWDIMQMPTVDMICTPINYSSRRRGMTGLRVNAFDGSARLAEKILWQEDDPRTHLCLYLDGNRSSNLAETIEVQRRSAAQAITRGTAVWWLLFDNAWFHQNEIISALQENVRLTKEATKRDRRPVAKAAIIFDEESHYYLSINNNSLLYNHTWTTYQNAVSSGIMFDYYYQNDMLKDNMPDYKLYIFLTPYSMDKAKREKIQAKLAKSGAVAVWCYAPGFFDNHSYSVENMKKLTGFNFKMLRNKNKITTKNQNIPSFGYIPGASYAVDPQFFVTDKSLVSTKDGGVLAIKDMGKWRSVYSLFPLTRQHLRAISNYAGVHIYSNSSDQLFVNNSYLMIHTAKGGNKTITFPKGEKYTVTELYTNKKLGTKVPLFVDKNVPAGTTRLYLLEK
jgi:hypothetical protein